jgi:hypothetical protein
MKTLHQNSEGLAKGLLPYIETALPNSTCRPWNRYEFQETEWLLSPVREWPLCRVCKYYTDMVRGEDPMDGELCAGIYVEKGFTGDAAKMNKANECMDASWGWHTVLTDIRSGKIADVLTALPAECRDGTEIAISGGYDGPTYGTYRLRLRFSDDGAPFTVHAEEPVPHLAAIGSVTSWETFAKVMDTLAVDDWLWVDMYIHIRLSLASRTGVSEGEVWTDQELWNHFLQPLEPWVSQR